MKRALYWGAAAWLVLQMPNVALAAALPCDELKAASTTRKTSRSQRLFQSLFPETIRLPIAWSRDPRPASRIGRQVIRHSI